MSWTIEDKIKLANIGLKNAKTQKKRFHWIKRIQDLKREQRETESAIIAKAFEKMEGGMKNDNH